MFNPVRTGISAVAIGLGIASVDPQKGITGWCARLGKDRVALFNEIAALGSLSGAMAAEIAECPEFSTDGFHGLYSYEVDEDFGMRIAEAVRDDPCYTAFDCPALRRALARQATSFFAKHQSEIPITLALVRKWTETMDPDVSGGASAVAIAEGMGLFIASGNLALADWKEEHGYGYIDVYTDLAQLAAAGTALRDAVAREPDVVDVRDRAAYHREVDERLGQMIVFGCKRDHRMQAIDGSPMRRGLARLAYDYFGAAQRPCARLGELIADAIGVHCFAAVPDSRSSPDRLARTCGS